MKALVLSGGGAKGAYQVGALNRWMADEGHDYDAICGISVGAINGAFMAQFPCGNREAVLRGAAYATGASYRCTGWSRRWAARRGSSC